MNVGEILNKLVNAESYLEEKLKVSDDFIDMVRCCMPTHYDYISEKEKAYKDIVQLLGETK